MAGGIYSLWLTDDKGAQLEPLDDALWWSASRQVNRIGHFMMGLPASFDDNLLAPDRMVQIWRQPPGGNKKLWRVYFVRGWRLSRVGSRNMTVIWGPDTNDLLRRRVVAHYAGEAQASYTATEADNMMKDIVTNSIADGTNPAPDAGTRVWGDLSVAVDLTDGPQLNKAGAWRKLLTEVGSGILVDIASAARVAGTEVFFDIVPRTVSSTEITFVFRTYTNQPGQDVTDRVVFAEDDRNLLNPFLEYDYSIEENYIYAGGQGEENERYIAQVYDANRYNVSQWGRCEGFADARDQDTDDGAREVGRLRLDEGRPRIRAGGIPVDMEGTRFGLDWDFGDKVRMRFRRREFDCIVRSVILRMGAGGDETIETRLEYES